MPRFYFNVCDHISTPDDTGTELPDWQEARVQAINLAGAVIKDDAARIALSEDWHLNVTDDRGLLLFRFDFIAWATPAITGGRIA